jgi:ubiquinone/menaquinone biosynthesis C-methylase UbiE
MTVDTSTTHEQAVEQVAQRVLDMALGTADLLAVYLGDRLGWYGSLHVDGPATAEQLAQRTGTSPRYAREWLEQQAVSGVLVVDVPEQADSAAVDATSRRFRLPAPAAEVFTDERSLSYLAPLARMFASSAGQLPSLLDAYRTGGGVSWEQLGADARESQADINRPWFETALAPALAGVPALHERLRRPGARVADVGCGGGWSTLALARAYPQASLVGIDVDAPSLDMARGAAQEAGLGEQVRFLLADAAELPADGFDVVFAFECLHDMPQPVAVLRAVRRALAPGGTVVVMDEAVAEQFAAPGDELERLMYGFSLLVCLPDGMSHPTSAGTGTVMRPETLRAYAREAGFADVDVLPVEGFGFWRFYELRG